MEAKNDPLNMSIFGSQLIFLQKYTLGIYCDLHHCTVDQERVTFLWKNDRKQKKSDFAETFMTSFMPV